MGGPSLLDEPMIWQKPRISFTASVVGPSFVILSVSHSKTSTNQHTTGLILVGQAAAVDVL